MTPDNTITTTTYTERWNTVWDGAQAQAASLHMAHGMMATVAVMLVVFSLFYFLPTLIASVRHHPHTTLIFLLNLLFGFTIAGWILALLWALTSPSPRFARPL